ncbi:MAG: hypothetical protein ACI9XR_002020 [Flavobacterium sp.]|jgi:hypothetical protein
MDFFKNIKPVTLYIVGSSLLGIAAITTKKESFTYWIFSVFGLILIFLAIMKHFKK